MKFEDQVNRLIESENISIRYRTLREIVGLSDTDPTIRDLKQQLPNQKAVKTLLDKMHPDGYWLQTNPRTGVTLGDDVEFGAYATTHYILSYLMELGLTKEHPVVAKASERYLNLQKEDGDWWEHMSCLSGINLRTFIRLGYRDDPRIVRSLNLMLDSLRHDNGYLCDMHQKKKKDKKKSCYRGSLKMLLGFSELPELWQNPVCVDLVDYFLNRKGIFNSELTLYACKDIEKLSFPVSWRSNLWELLIALSKMGHGNDSRLKEAWELISSYQSENGFYILHLTPASTPFKVGSRNKQNDWITFYVLLAKKYLQEVG